MRKPLFWLIFSIVFASPSFAAAFCGFYVAGGGAKLFNDATQVVLMRDAKTTVLSMQNNYEGPTADFAMVVPVPQILQKENVKTLDKEVFDRVDRLSAPRLVEYWERDPCSGTGYGDGIGNLGTFGGLGMSGYGRGGGGRGTVKVEAQFEVGEYDIVILSTDDATALDGWLKDNKYNIPQGAEPYFRPYVEKGSYFFVARVNAKKVKYEDGKAVLSPLRFHYQSDEFSLPIRLGMINSKGKQDLLVYILGHSQRYEVANYPNVTIPTNIEVGTDARENFGEFYEALFSRTIEENPKAVVTEYSWAATKCDPCPSGMMGGAALRIQDLAKLGNDVIGKRPQWNAPGWTLTRLHARYSPNDIGEDLVFQKAKAIVGGRESYSGDEGNRILEKGAEESKVGDNFQGRYIIRHEWEGKVECETPSRGMWGPPPDPHGMKLVADVVVAERRRATAKAAGREVTKEELDAPHTAEDMKAIGFHMRERFGTSVAPLSVSSGPASAPSANTRGGKLGGVVQLASLIQEPIPELNLVPAPEPTTASTSTAGETNGTATTPTQAPKEGKEVECRTTGGRAGLEATLLLALVVVARRRKRR